MTSDPDPWPDLAGRLTPGGHVLPIRVYFEDTDFSGVVYHASYLRFLERGRSDFLRLLGVSHNRLGEGAEGESLAFAVRHMEIDFLRGARIDDVLQIETALADVTRARIVLRQRVRRGEETIVEATVTVVIVNAAGKPRRLPPSILGRLSASATE
jgi:acyl-CoA thioester hydrolase